MLSKDGEPGLNYLCKGYYQFFDHVAPYMDFMKKEYLAERAPANVMEWREKREINRLFSVSRLYGTSKSTYLVVSVDLFDHLGTFIKYYKISQLIHTQSIAN